MRFSLVFSSLALLFLVHCNAVLGTEPGEAHAARDAGLGDGNVENPLTIGGPFRVERSGADGVALRAVWGTDKDHVWAVGEGGTFLRRETNGEWTQTASAAPGYDMYGLWGAAPNDIYAVGTIASSGAGIIFHFDGVDWRLQATVESGLSSIARSKDRLVVAGRKGYLYAQQGTSWVRVGNSLPTFPDVGTNPDDPNVNSLVANPEGLFLGTGGLHGAYVIEPSGQVTQSGDGIDHSRTFRTSWPVGASGPNFILGGNYYGVTWMHDRPDQLALVYDDRSTPETKNLSLWGMWSTHKSDALVMVGDKGRIATWRINAEGTDKGVKVQPTPTRENLYGVWGASHEDIWIVGGSGIILHGTMLP